VLFGTEPIDKFVEHLDPIGSVVRAMTQRQYSADDIEKVIGGNLHLHAAVML
jgi:hypothetical protein